MPRQNFLDHLRAEVLIGDGALGTLFDERGVGRETPYERLNQTHPRLVRELHQDYLDAGAIVLETNTFGANRTKLPTLKSPGEIAALNQAGAALAREVAGKSPRRAYVAGAVGPLAQPLSLYEHPSLSDDEIRDIFREQITALADAGVDVILLETFADLKQLLLALEVAKTDTDLPVICQMAFHERGHTQAGVHALTALAQLSEAGADVIGANCGRGVRAVVAAIEMMAKSSDRPLSAFPNAGLPEYRDGRYRFGAPLPYFVDAAQRMVDMGVNLIGGCCGTTPKYIRQLVESLPKRAPAVRVREEPSTAAPAVPVEVDGAGQPHPESLIYRVERGRGLSEPVPGRRPAIVVELDPPRGLDYEPIIRRAQQLRDMGVDAITMADNPVATLHMGNLTLADIVQREADIPVILHLTCRDSNLLGLQSRLLEAHVRGVHHILALTGDPARVGDTPGATSVYDLNSFGLIELIGTFNSGTNHAGVSIGGRTHFTIGVAFNPNGRNLRALVDRLRRKVAKGAHFAMTQPMYDLGRYDEMVSATSDITAPIFVGIMPLLSERNAEFLHNEVPGIVLTDETRQRMKGIKGKEGRREGIRLCSELIDHMLPTADGFYIIPPQRFTEMAVELVGHINASPLLSAAGG